MVSPVGEGDRPRALDTLVLAFAADPVERGCTRIQAIISD
jgi:hypothetical protein